MKSNLQDFIWLNLGPEGSALSNQSESKPHVLVFDAGLPVSADWVRASEVAAAVSTARFIRKTLLSRDAATHAGRKVDYEISSIRLRPQRIFWRVNNWLRGRALIRMIDQLRRSGRAVSIVHGHFFSDSGALPHLTRARGIPFVVSEHSSSLTSLNPDNHLSVSGLHLARQVFEKAAFVLPVSEFLAGEIRGRGLGGRFEVVPNPINTNLFTPGTLNQASQIVTVARLARVKRLEFLLEAFSRILESAPEARLTIVGDGPEREELETVAADLSIDDKVQFLGRIARELVPGILASSSVFVSTSLTETFGVAILEAMACGLPVVAPRTGGIPEVMRGAPGELFEPDDSHGLAVAILRWINPTASERSRARDNASRTYSVSSVGTRLKAIYGEVLGSPPTDDRISLGRIP